MTVHLELEATTGGYEVADQERDRIEPARTNIARLVGGHPDEIALSDAAGAENPIHGL